ncbi:MAG: ComF family protein [Deltaproteobacteria bacterium]|nr:ComF family protein [Deltaproteobacteria bacterium]
MGRVLGDLVAPRRCAACDELLAGRALLCATCATTVERYEGAGEPAAFGLYGGAIAQALRRLKYGNRPDLGPILGMLLRDHVLGRLSGPAVEVVVPVPVPKGRLVERGYNQASLLAAPLVGPLGARFAPLALWRAEGVKQAALGRDERMVNLRGALKVRRPLEVQQRHVLLVDDVSTTGATIEACTSVLIGAGARSVRAIVVARTESGPRDAAEIGCGRMDGT